MSRRGRSAVDHLGLPFRQLGNHSGSVAASLTSVCLERLKTTADDCYRRPSHLHEGHGFVPPYCLRFSNSALGGHAMAVADEDGTITVFDTTKPMLAIDGPVCSWSSHHNAVYQVEWMNHDEYVATASADQTCKIWDLQQQTCLHELRGHTGSIKAVTPSTDCPSILATGARDGVINMWDLRSSEGSVMQRPFASIAGAHKLAKRTGRQRNSSSLQHSVTCARFSTDGYTLLSAGIDGCIKGWDTRYLPVARRKTPAPAFTIDCSAKHGAKSGIASLDISKDGTRALVSLTSSQCLVYNVQRPEDDELGSYYGHLNTHSYFVKSCFSPDDRMFLSGSSDGRLYIWEVDRPGAPVIQMSCHRSEVGNVDWCRADPLKIVSGSDDGFIRLWRYWRYRDSVSRIERPTVPSHDSSAPSNTPAAWVCCGSTRFVDSVAHDTWSTRAWRGTRDEIEEPSTDEDEAENMDVASKLAEDVPESARPRMLSRTSSLSQSSSTSSPPTMPGPPTTPRPLEETTGSVRTLRRASSLPPVLPSSMSLESGPVLPCVLFDMSQPTHGPAAFASSFTRARPGDDGAHSAAATSSPPVAALRAEVVAAACHKTPEKQHPVSVRDEPSPLGLVGHGCDTPCASPNRVLEFELATAMKRSFSEQAGNRPKRSKHVNTRQPTLTQLWQGWGLSSSSSAKEGAEEHSGG